ncbi:dirigent protein 22-like [Olea europaea var. sylvestris]|uniref:dirigent protein 22-like n=1 Tax=Olea europaea var. sylvestris TaxID=158386 RepID=UPI000C1D5BF4|nr:dirigent protein 22-like [Olea europaea var. sylvestris]
MARSDGEDKEIGFRLILQLAGRISERDDIDVLQWNKDYLLGTKISEPNTRVLISIVFTNEEYKGSTFEIQGSSAQFERVKEVARVGGTGIFRLASSYSTFEMIHYDATTYYAVIQCNVTILHY